MPDSNSYLGQPPTPPTAVIVSNGFALYPEKAFARHHSAPISSSPFLSLSLFLLPLRSPPFCACPAITTNLAYINFLTDITLGPLGAKPCEKFLDENRSGDHCYGNKLPAVIRKSYLSILRVCMYVFLSLWFMFSDDNLVSAKVCLKTIELLQWQKEYSVS